MSRRTAPALFAALALALGAILASAAPAAAHDQLVDTDPAAGSTVDAVPDAVSLTFSADLLADADLTAIEVTTATGTPVQEGDPVVSGPTVTQAITTSAEPGGTYTVEYKVVSSDGHPVSGSFAFVVALPSPTPTAAPTRTVEPSPASTAPTAAPEEADPPLVWPIVVVIAAAAVAAVAYLALSRARRKSARR
ncbi:MAG: copper resistance protein CopC [Microbacterium sp.]